MQETSPFQIEQSTDADGVVRLRLLGELDLAVASVLDERLRQLRDEQALVRIDLSELAFMDSSGLGIVLSAVLDARRDGWQLEIEPTLARPVKRIVEIAGAGPYLWPDSPV